jgi:hypothetical protein
MRQYFEKMTEFGAELNKGQILSSENNVKAINEVEAGIDEEVEKVKNAGMPTEKINSRGVMTVWQRLEYLVDPGTWNPLHTLKIMLKVQPMSLTALQKFPVNGVLLQDLTTRLWQEHGCQGSLKIFCGQPIFQNG